MPREDDLKIAIRPFEAADVETITAAFAAIGWHRTESQYRRYLEEQVRGERVVLVAHLDGSFVGYLTVAWRPDYPPFARDGIPEVQDLNVLPECRRRGVATALMDEAERLVSARSPVIGIGVGLFVDYGPAQRLYARRGYVPDGEGIYYRERPVTPMREVMLDDDLVLHLTKQCPGGPP
ncbi:MAG: GNAT family N-acetyltransferase [Dehalococcoidales bacterium]